MPPEMLTPLQISMLGIYLLFAVSVLWRARAELLWRERKSAWVKELV
jgi:heme exporter protein C